MQVAFETRNEEALDISRTGQMIQYGAAIKSARRAYVFVLIAFVAAWIAYVFVLSDSLIDLGLAEPVVFFGGLAILMVAAAYLLRNITAKYRSEIIEVMERDLPDGVPVTISFDEWGVYFAGEGMKLQAAWHRVTNIQDVPMRKSEPMIGFFGPRVNFFVPDRAFKSGDERSVFLAQALDAWQIGKKVQKDSSDAKA